MQQASLELQNAVRGDYTKIDRVLLTRDGSVILELEAIAGSVDADSGAEAARRFTADVPIPAGMEELIPYDLDDPTAPFGTEAIVATGARIPAMSEVVLIAEDATGWNAGTRLDMVVDGNGDLVLGFS
jgi:hypothetical protein